MLRSFLALKNYAVFAADGRIGSVQDLLLDAQNETVQYLVIETGQLWQGRLVPLSPDVVDYVNAKIEGIWLDLYADEITDSSGLPDLPRASGLLGGLTQTNNGGTGRVKDLMLDDEGWTVHHVVVDLVKDERVSPELSSLQQLAVA